MKRQMSVGAPALTGAVVGVGLFAFSGLGVSDASAAAINYGSFPGTNVIFQNVTEEATTPGDTAPLFGAPIVTGDSMDFNPVGFAASTVGPLADITNGNLVFSIQAKPGAVIQVVTLSEIGDATLAGNVTPGSQGTAAAVFGTGTLDIHEVNGVGINHISVPFSLTFSPSGGTYFLGTDGGGGPLFNTQWTGSVTIPVDAILTANGIAGDATRVSIDLDNTLTAVSETGTSALIAKEDFGLRVDIPEPVTGATVALAALVLAPMRLRRRTIR